MTVCPWRSHQSGVFERPHLGYQHDACGSVYHIAYSVEQATGRRVSRIIALDSDADFRPALDGPEHVLNFAFTEKPELDLSFGGGPFLGRAIANDSRADAVPGWNRFLEQAEVHRYCVDRARHVV